MQKYESYKDSGEQWLGKIPSHWNVLAIKHILKLRKEVVGKKANQYDLLSLTLQGIIKRDMENPTGKFPSSFDTYQVVYPNDFVFCNFDNEETPRAVGLSDYKGMITGAYDVLYRYNDLLTDKFLIYYFLYIDDAKRFKPLYKGLRKSIPYDSFMAYKLPIPSIEEQNRMVAYLDEQTSLLDEAIAQQQKMIDLLNERKQIIINEAVTKGLNPNAPMKDSGIEWIGKIPEHWNIFPLKRCCDLIREKVTDKEEFRVALENIESWTGEYITSDSEYEGIGVKFTRGDVLFGKLRPYLAKVYLAEKTGEALGDIWVLRSNSHIYSQYLQTILLSKRIIDTIDSSTYGAKMPRADWNTNSKICIPVPPVEEQKAIVVYLSKINENIGKQIFLCKKQLDFLRERKQIIINEVVTGKIKV